MVAPSEPGRPVDWRMVTPELRPDKAEEMLVIGLEVATSSNLIDVTDRVLFNFLLVYFDLE